MRAADRLYRPAAVRRLNAGDETDELPAFARPPRWLAAAGLLLALAAAAAWALAVR